MRLSEAGELSLLDRLRKRFREKASDLVLGIGDDCAVIRPKDKNLLLTTDMMVEGVHFDLRWTTPFQVGFKLVSVNVSDIYAMGGTPRFLLLNFAAGRDFDMMAFDRLFDGIGQAAKKYGVLLVGGDISSSDKLVLSATLTGYGTKVIRRSGARPGDRIYVTGTLGNSACGLRLMKKTKKTVEIEKRMKAEFAPGWKTVLPLIRRHLMPVAVKPDRFIEKATSMIDISDGLLMDLSRICRESRTGADIYMDRIPCSAELKKAAAYLRIDPLELALSGGEDYELLFTAPEDAEIDAFCIGEITRSGMQLIDHKGESIKMSSRGYQHFAD